MKTTQLLTLLAALVMYIPDIYAQDDKTDVPQPKIDIQIQKDTDEEGNVIRMDSSYTWSWSGCGDLDSLMTAFGDQFDMNFDFPMDFSFNFQVPVIDLDEFRFNFSDSTIKLEEFDEFFENFHLKMGDPFEKWGGEEAFRKHFEEKFDQDELEKRIESFMDSKAFQKNMEQLMEKQQEFIEKHQELMEKFQEKEFNRQEEEKIQQNRYQHYRENGTKAI